jgi:hypothetical protein
VKLIITSILLCVQFVTYAQPKDSLKHNAFSFVDSCFMRDSYKIEMLDFEFAPELQVILQKFQSAIGRDKEWFEKYFSDNYKAGEGLPYHEKFGVTKEEYQKVKDIPKNPPLVVVKDSAILNVLRVSNVISISSADPDFDFLESLTIDVVNHSMIFLKDTIPLKGQIFIQKNSAIGEWSGYEWKIEESNLGENDPLKLDKFIFKTIAITIGKIKETSRTYLSLKYKSANKGEVLANFEVMCRIYN